MNAPPILRVVYAPEGWHAQMAWAIQADGRDIWRGSEERARVLCAHWLTARAA